MATHNSRSHADQLVAVAGTMLPLRQMRLSLDSQLATKRVFLVLDCCFAGRAATEWQADGIGHVIEDQVFQSFPKRGTALIAASAKGMPAVAPEGEPTTMFTGVLVDVVKDGLKGAREQLSFREVFEAVKARIIDRYGARAATPVIHAPHQPDGDISFDPFFLNRGYVTPPPPTASLAEREHFDLAVAELDRPLVKTRVAAVEALAELHANARSAVFRAEIVDRLRRVQAEDDSNSVKSGAREALSAMGAGGAEDTVAPTPPPPEDDPAQAGPVKPEPDAKPPLPWWRHVIEGTGTLAAGLAALAIGGAIVYFVLMFGGMFIDKAGDGISYLGTAVVELVNGKPAAETQPGFIGAPLGRWEPIDPTKSLLGQPRVGSGSLADQMIKGAIPDSTPDSSIETPPPADEPLFKTGQ